MTFRCAVQSVDFPLTGRRIVPTLQQGSEQFSPTYRVGPYERSAQSLSTEQLAVETAWNEQRRHIYIRSEKEYPSISIIQIEMIGDRQTDSYRQSLRQYSFIPTAAFQRRAGSVYGADDEEPQRCVSEWVSEIIFFDSRCCFPTACWKD